MTETAEWKFDADQHDPLTALRIPVTSAYPHWRYTATFDRESEVRPTDAEALMLASFIEEYREHWFNTDAVTRIFHKWSADDWSYRVVTWERGPFWVPVSPRQRGGQYDAPPWRGPLTLVQVMNRIHTIGDEPMKHWTDWKSAHPEIFPAPGAEEEN